MVVLAIHKSTIICYVCFFFFFFFFFNATAVISGRVVPPILWAENTSLGRVVVPGPSPHSILRSLIAPHRSAAPFQHNNSIVAPGASCHPELSFVLPFVISPRLNVFSLCDCPVSPLIITTDHITWTEWKRQNDGYTLWTVCTHCKFSPLSLKVDETHLLQDIRSLNEWQCWFDVNLFMVWKFVAWSFPLDDNPLPSVWPPSPPPHLPSLWCFHPSVSAPAAPAPVWKDARCTKRPTVSACSMARWHQPRCHAYCLAVACGGGIFIEQLTSMHSDKVKEKVAWFLSKAVFCNV